MGHQIGQFTGEIIGMELSSLENPQEDCVLEEDMFQLERIKREARGLANILADEDYTPVQRRTQLESIIKALKRIEKSADIKIKAMDRRKLDSRQSQDIMLIVLQEIETELAEKKASAIVIFGKAQETRERVEAALIDVLV